MEIQIATPFSDLFKDVTFRKAILDLSDIVEIRAPEQIHIVDHPWIFHSELNLTTSWDENDRFVFSGMACNPTYPELISFHMASRYKHNLLYNGAFHGVGDPYTYEEMESNAMENVGFLRDTFGSGVAILVENNNDLGTDAYHLVTDGSFISRIVENNNIQLLWDMAHSRITTLNRNIDHEVYLNSLPLDQCVQVHLSRLRKRADFAYDAHELMMEEDWVYFSHQITRLPMLKYVTIEYYRDGTILQEQIRKLRLILKEK